MDILLIKLFVAHVLGDFFLQPDKWVIEKEARKLKSPKLYYHVLIHGFLMLLLVFDTRFLYPILLLTVLHGIVDAIKLSFQNQHTKRVWFFIDQVLHISAIVVIWYIIRQPTIPLDIFNSHKFWITALGFLFLSFPSSIIIKTLIAKWTPGYIPPSANLDSASSAASLQSAGKYIGIMERLLVLIFAYSNHWEAIGFLIAAKSIFRFGDLKEGNDLKLTEYILIGTLLSFGIAIVTSIICLNAIGR